jgi:hypothetical protein
MSELDAEFDDDPDAEMFSSDSACYNPERDGTLAEYLETHDGHSCFPLFKGLGDFQLLKDEGWLEPRISIIRLMWNVGRGDEHFFVTDEFYLEGIENDHHGGRAGIHTPENIFKKAPPFEAHHLWGPAWKRGRGTT